MSRGADPCTIYELDVIGWSGLLLILFFTLNGAYIGSRLGLCWELLSENFEEFNDPHVRDPYPLIAEKAGLAIGPRTSKILRNVSIGKFLFFLNHHTSSIKHLFYRHICST